MSCSIGSCSLFYAAEVCSSWYPRDVQTARHMMQYNLATCHAIRGEFEKSLAHLKQTKEGMGEPLPSQMIALNIYLELMEGWLVLVVNSFQLVNR